jgi:hypothetical protein
MVRLEDGAALLTCSVSDRRSAYGVSVDDV